MFCKNCGKQLADDAKFCANCGTPAAPPAPQEPSTASDDPIKFPGAGFPGDDAPISAPPISEPSVSEGAPVEEPSASEAESPLSQENAPAADPAVPVSAPTSTLACPLPADGSGADSSPVKRRGKAGLVVLGVGAVVVIAVVVLLVNVLGGLFSGGGKAMYAYRNDDGELMYLPDLKEKTTALELTDEADFSANVRFSPDGKSVYFTDADHTLYGITLSALKKGDKPERISRNVGSFFLLKDGRLLYTEYDSSESRLSLYEKGESFRLLKGYSDYQFSEDQKTIYYTERDETDDTLTLYKMALAKDAKEERLLKGATTIYTRYDAGTLVYGEDERGAYGSYAASSDGSVSDNNTLTVYSCTPGGDKTKLIDDIYSITGVTVDGGKVSFHYYIQNVEERTLYDFVTDTNAGADASTLSGEAPVYPSWSDYSPRNYGIEADGTTVYYTDRSGAHYTIPASVIADILSGTDRTVSDLRTYELSSYANDDARERYDADMEDYNTRRDTWNEAQTREYVRQSLKDTSYNQTSLSLYHYTGSDKNEPIATQISSGSRIASASDGIFLYRKVSLEGGKVADVADLDYAGEVRSLLSEGAGGDDWYQNVGGKESVIDLDDVSGIYSIYVLNGKEVVLDVYDEDGVNMLQAFSLGKEALTFTSTIIDDDFTGPYWGQSSGKDVLYLFTDPADDSSGTVGDFSVYRDGKLETIAKEVYGALILDESGATYVVADLDSRSYSAELALLKDGKTTTISDEVSGDFIFLDDTQLLYLSDGDLMLWDGKQERRIARDVEEFWASVSEEYTSYSPN